MIIAIGPASNSFMGDQRHFVRLPIPGRAWPDLKPVRSKCGSIHRRDVQSQGLVLGSKSPNLIFHPNTSHLGRNSVVLPPDDAISRVIRAIRYRNERAAVQGTQILSLSFCSGQDSAELPLLAPRFLLHLVQICLQQFGLLLPLISEKKP